jgi:hypothetical protein
VTSRGSESANVIEESPITFGLPIASEHGLDGLGIDPVFRFENPG